MQTSDSESGKTRIFFEDNAIELVTTLFSEESEANNFDSLVDAPSDSQAVIRAFIQTLKSYSLKLDGDTVLYFELQSLRRLVQSKRTYIAALNGHNQSEDGGCDSLFGSYIRAKVSHRCRYSESLEKTKVLIGESLYRLFLIFTRQELAHD